MVPRKSPKPYNMVISLPKLAAVMTRPLTARPIQRTHAKAGDNSPVKPPQHMSAKTSQISPTSNGACHMCHNRSSTSFC